MEEKNLGNKIKDAIMTGIGYMIPIVIAGALIMAIGNLMAGELDPTTLEGTMSYNLYTWGKALFNMMNIVLGMYTAYRIGGRLALPAGIVAGMVATDTSAGFLGAVIGGVVAGFLVDFLNKKIKLPTNVIAAKTLVIIPFLSCLALYPFMYYIVVPVATWFITILTNLLTAAQSFSPFIFGGLLASLVGVGMGSFPGWASFAVAMVMLEQSRHLSGLHRDDSWRCMLQPGYCFCYFASEKEIHC